MASVVALIPARAGSKGVPDKNVRVCGGHPLLAWTIAACLKSKCIERTIVSIDSSEYALLSQTLGAEAPFLRPAEISGDNSTDTQFILHALDWLGGQGAEPKYIVHMRPTTPARDPRLVDEAVAAFRETSKATALRSIQEMSESAYKTFELAADGRLKRVCSESTALDAANSARQEFPRTYHPNGYVDVLSTAFIRRTGLLHGDKVLPFLTPPVIEVDTEDDFALLEGQLSRAPAIARQLFG